MRRTARAWLVGLLVTISGAVLVLPGRALAHAELLSTNPTAGAVLDESPATITLTFSEPVEINLGGIRLFDGSGNEVDVGATKHPDGHDSQVGVDVGELANGSYVVDWRVVSADSHPVQGAFTFQIGATSNLQPGIITDIINSAHTSRSASVALGVMRGLVIGAIAIVFGGLIIVGLGIVSLTRRVRAIVAASAAIGTVAGLLQLPLEVGYATGRSFSTLFESSAWSAAFDSRVGVAWVVRAAIIGAVGGALLILAEDRERWWWRGTAVAALAAVGLASAYGGHGATGRWVPIGVVDTALHVAAMAVWLGGVLLVLVELRSATAASVRRFSALALGMVVVLVATGSLQAVRQLGSFDALTDTTYGTILIRKLVVVAILLALAFVSRRIVHRAEVDMPRLGRSVMIEVLAAVAIVVFTSLLMASNPSNVAASKPFSVTLIDGDYLASITVEPGRVGSNEMHLYLSDAVSSLTQPDSVTVEISDPTRDVAALQIPVTRSGAGHFTTSTATFPYAATWTLTVTARYNTFDEVQFTAQVKIR